MLPIWNVEQRTPPPPTVEHGCVGVELLGCYSASGARSLLRVWIRSEKNVLEYCQKGNQKSSSHSRFFHLFGLCLLGFVIYFSRVRHHLLLPSCRLLIFVLLFLFFIFLLCFSPCSSSFSSSLPLCPPSPSPSSTIQSLETGEDFFRRPKQIVITNTVAKPLN